MTKITKIMIIINNNNKIFRLIILMIKNFWIQRSLLIQLWKRDFAVRYKNGILQTVWAFLNPLLMLALYSFVFVFVFKLRWQTGADTQANFVIMLFSGIVTHGVLAEFLGRAPTLISSHTIYVKKVVFPLEFLPLLPLFGSLINFLVGMILVVILLLYSEGSIPPTVVLLPFVLIPYVLMILGISYFLSAIGVFLRDLNQLTGLLSTVTLFASPVLFPLEIMPAAFRPYLYFNPITVILEQLRKVSILGTMPDWTALGIYTVIACIVFALGLSWFQSARKGFADVL